MLRRGAWFTCLVTTSLEDLARAELSCVEGDDFEACSSFPSAVAAPALLQRQKATAAISSVVAAAALEELDEHEQQQQPSSPSRKKEPASLPATDAAKSSGSTAKPSAPSKGDVLQGHDAGSEGKGVLPPSFFQTLLVVNKERHAKHQVFDALSLEPDALTAVVAVMTLLLLTAVAAFLALRHRSKVAPSDKGLSGAAASASKEGKQPADGNAREPIIAGTGETGAEEEDSDSDSDTEIGCTGAALFDGPMWDAFGLTPQTANASGPMAYRSIAALQLEEKVARQGDFESPCVGDVGAAPETGCAP